MKKTFLALVLMIAAIVPASMAQKNVKLGHINSNELMQIMPGRDSAQAAFQKEVEDLQATLKTMQDELETRYNEYRAKESQMSDLIKQTKQRELQDMGARMEEFQKNAQQQLQDREQELLKPIIDRAKNAIEEVGKERGYTYIFDSGVGALLYQQDSEDIMPFVKAKLNL
ncbi:MAG: OmpH family outer membrane protein [Bacteroidales bacterium]|nr:OmpH family outer membrane protein [Bacteroidales bacterium]